MTGFHSATEHDVEGPRKRVAVIAAHSLAASGSSGPAVAAAPPDGIALERLLASLEHVFPVCFEEQAGAEPREVDAVLVLDPARLRDVQTGVPRLVLPARARSRGEAVVVALADDECLARALRGRAIRESAVAGELPLSPPRTGAVLAQGDGRPLWWQAGEGPERLCVSAYPLAEPGAGETLRDHLRADRFMGLLPLVHFLGEILGGDGWKLPSPRASFLVDDPNLHWPSYGYLDYRRLAAHAARHGYHLGLATVPLDGWRADRRAASLVREEASGLSLLVHGNDHVARELGRLRTDSEAESAIGQALRRIAKLEHRAGVTVDRVMAPPHGACSEEALRAMFRLGFEAVCISRSYPWRDGLPAPTPLAGWHPAELVAGGLPVLLRRHLAAPREDLAFRALLGQPFILYGHHGDFAKGLDLLEQAAADINGLGDVRWGSLGWVAGGGYATRRVGERLLVRMHARRVAIEVPDGVRALRVVAQEPLGGPAWHRVAHPGGTLSMAFEGGWGNSEMLPVEAPGRIALSLVADRPLRPADVPSRGVRTWPVIRRALVEGRDRLQPLF